MKAEIRLLRDSVEITTKRFMEPRLQEKARLEDTLARYVAPFEKSIALLKEKALSSEREFRKDLRVAKEQHFSSHGHNPDSQGSLNRIIDDLVSQKENKVKKYQVDIRRVEKAYKSDPFFLQTTQRIAELASEMEEGSKDASHRLKVRIKELEDSLLLYNP